MIYKVLGLVVAAVFLVSMFGFDDSWAVKSHGIKQTVTMSNNVCGLELCSTSQNTEQKISNYLENIEKSSIKIFDFEDLDKNIAHITKTSIVSKDFLLVHYSDGNWELVNRAAFANTPLRGDDRSFDEDSDVVTVGRLAVSDTKMIRPLSTAVKEIRIYGTVGEIALPNILLKVAFPDRPAQDFILSVDDTGSFEAQLNIEKDTPLGVYEVTATYASVLVGNVIFEITENKVLAMAAHDTSEKINSITLSTNQVTIPSSFSSTQTIQVSGTLADYNRGNMVELILVSANGDESPRKIPATKDGVFSTFIIITPEFPEGVTEIIVKYNGKEVTRTSLTATSPIFTLR